MAEDAPPQDATLRDERKVVTALFADIADSTSLGAQLDPEEFRLIVGEAVDRMIRAVNDYGGTVKEIAGDGLLALFGAPTVYEDDAERAIRAALAIAATIKRYAQEVEEGWGIEAFAVRVGVCTGPAILGTVGTGEAVDYTGYGDSVNTAARLQSHAAPGSILVDRTTHLVTEQIFSWGPAQDLELRGKEGLTTAYSVEGTIVAEEAPAPLIRTELIGRDSEYERLTELAESLAAGRGSILFLTGEAGIGKSRLLGELRQLVETRPSEVGPARWLEGNAASYGEATPFWPFRDLIRRWLGVAQDEPDLRVRVALRREIDRLFQERIMEVYPYLASMLALGLEPESSERLSGLSPESLQYRTFEVMAELLERASYPGPTLLLNGERDSQNVKAAPQMAAAAQHSSIHVIEDAGHACSLSQPDAFTEAVRAFVGSVVDVDRSGTKERDR